MSRRFDGRRSVDSVGALVVVISRNALKNHFVGMTTWLTNLHQLNVQQQALSSTGRETRTRKERGRKREGEIITPRDNNGSIRASTWNGNRHTTPSIKKKKKDARGFMKKKGESSDA